MIILNRLLSSRQFDFIKKLQKKFPKAEIFLVGGIIRDHLLRRESKDYDFVVRNVPAANLQRFLKSLGWVDLVGKTFGVLKFVPRGVETAEAYDIALPRTEHAFMTGGYRDFTVRFDHHLPIEEDLKRRDFTVNAFAYDIKERALLDPCGGMQDLRRKIIRAVGDPGKRFQEDYSRTLRALRFACQLNFTIEPKTWQGAKKAIERINTTVDGRFIVPREVVAKELVKAFRADPARAFTLYEQAGATRKLMPELLKMRGCPQPRNFHSEGDVWKHTRIALGNLSSKKFLKKFGREKNSTELIVALLFHDLGKPYTIERADRLRFNNHDVVGSELAQKIMERLKLSAGGVDMEKSAWLIRKHMLVTHSKKSPMKKTTLEKYFFNALLPGDDLLRLTFADIEATIPQSGKPDFTQYRSLERQLTALKKLGYRKEALPAELIDGTMIMKFLKLRPGPQIGQLKNLLREAQLKGAVRTKEQAYSFLKSYGRI